MIAFRICVQNIRKWLTNPRIKMCFLLCVIFTFIYTKGLRIASSTLGIDMNPWVFPFMMTTRYMKIVFMLVFVFMMGDAPFVDNNQVSVILRTKRLTWCVGQIMYIIVSSITYTMVLLLSSIILNVGHMQWGTTWGIFLGKIGNTGYLNTLKLGNTTVDISRIVIRYYSPLQAMILAFLLDVMSLFIIGLIIYLFNVIGKTKVVGVAVATVMIAFTAVVDLYPRLMWFSPMSWNSINNIDVADSTGNPTYGYILGIYSVMIIALVTVSVFAGKKQEIVVSDN